MSAPFGVGHNSRLQDAVIEEVGQFASDPLGFVLWNFPWGVPGTPLEHRRLRKWQREFLEELGKEMEAAKKEFGKQSRAKAAASR